MNGTGEREAEVGCRRKVYAQGGTGDLNQALATRGWTEGLGSGLHREEMAPGKVKDQGLGNAGARWRSLILG